MIPIWTRTRSTCYRWSCVLPWSSDQLLLPDTLRHSQLHMQHRSALSKLGCNPLNRSLFWGSGKFNQHFLWFDLPDGLGSKTCSTSLVPIPKAMAPKAPWVAVWLSPQTINFPGWVRPVSGAHHMNDSLLSRPWAA